MKNISLENYCSKIEKDKFLKQKVKILSLSLVEIFPQRERERESGDPPGSRH